jgi:MSHA pilin protein MshC
MCATSIDRPPARPVQGFTMVELITVMVLVGVLAVVAMPRLDAAMGLRSTAWRDQIKAAALHARGLAQSQRRVVCLTVATGELRLAMASSNPTTACDRIVPGSDGDARWAVDPQQLPITATPAATLYFQPDGRVTRGINGATYTNFSIAVAGETALAITGATGHVQ